MGKVTGIPLVIGKPLPSVGVFTQGGSGVVADNLVHLITAKWKPVSFAGHGECFLEAGHGNAGFGSGDFVVEPTPQVKLCQPGRALHLGEVGYKKCVLFE